MDGCQTLPLPAAGLSLSRDLGANLSPADGGATTEQRPTAELRPLPPAATLKSQLWTPAPNGETSVLNSVSPEGDVDCRLGDFRPSELFSDGKGDAIAASSPTGTASPRSCLRRCRPARRRSDSAAALNAISVRRRGSEAPPPRPRRVHFPASPITAVIPASDPLRLLGCGDVTAAYCAACERHGSRPLPEVLKQLEDPAADSLRLSGVTLTLADVDSLEEVMRRRQWRRVDAADCALRGETLAALLQIVTHYDAAPWLSLGGAASERLGWAAVCGAVRGAGRHSALQWLSLDRTAPSEVAAAALGRSLRDSRLRVLHLERCHLHGRPLLTLLAAGLRAATNLRQLYLGDNDLGAGDGSLLGAALRQNTSLQLLDLRNNAMDDDAAGYLLTCLAEQQPAAPHTGLLTLNLWHNRLTGDSAAPLATLLAAHPALETLNLGANPLGDGSAELLAEPLSRPGPLRRLGLQRCQLGDEAASALGRALAAGSGLVRLDLRGNRLGAAGLKALLAGVEDNVTLRQLDLDPEELSPERAPERATDAILRSVPESDRCGEGRDSPERADSGIDSPAKSADGGGDCDADGGSLEPDTDGGLLGTSADSTLGSSAGSDAPPSPPNDRASGDGAESAGIDSDSDSAPGGEYRSLLTALGTVCETNRQRPAPEPAAPPPPPLPEAEGEPPTGHWLRRRLSAAIRRVSLTCETPPRLPASAPAPSTSAPAPSTSAQPVPVPERTRHRRLISPSPSPSESPLPSPTSGRSRFRVFRVSSAEPPPGTPPLMRGMPRSPQGESERTPSPSPSREASPGPLREDSPVPATEDTLDTTRKDSIAVLRERNHTHGNRSIDSERSEGDTVVRAGSLETSLCDDGVKQWPEGPRVSSPSQWNNGRFTLSDVNPWTPTPSRATSAEWTPSHGPSTLSPDSGLGEAGQWQGGCESPGRCTMPRSSPRPAGRKFRVTPVRETPGPA